MYGKAAVHRSMFMFRTLLTAGFLAVTIGLSSTAEAKPQPPVVLLGKADALPLAIDPAFQIRKFKTYFLETPMVQGISMGGNVEQSLIFERRHLLFGAITGSDIRDRYGNYFTFFWRSQRPANLTIRLEYRQQKLGSMVQAREVTYPDAKGSFITRFEVNGDDYLEQGRVSAWRVLLIQDHKAIVALGQSYLWR